MDAARVKRVSQVLGILGDNTKLRIVRTLANQGEADVSSLCEMLGMSQPNASKNLALLRLAGLADYRRDGKHSIYSLNRDELRGILSDALEIAGCKT